ncbi:MAG: rRNA maturation RNase YbeY [Spirochaetia bacterium]|nr:rRNA maturation RNase YbeY [Spirochaetia bacterium]
MIVEKETGLEKPPDEFSLDFIYSVLDYLDIDNKEISIVLTGDNSISKLNKMYRNRDEPTDVLTFCQNEEIETFSIEAFSIEDNSNCLGDIIISLDTLKRNTIYFKVTFEEELNRLLIHGILHLLGMNHETNNKDETMLILQEKILKELKPLY